MLSSNKQTRQLITDLTRQGYVVSRTKKQHLRVTHPQRPGCVTMSSTPGDHRAILNTLRHLRVVLGYTPQSGVGVRR